MLPRSVEWSSVGGVTEERMLVSGTHGSIFEVEATGICVMGKKTRSRRYFKDDTCESKELGLCQNSDLWR